jgi:hypothetical protein
VWGVLSERAASVNRIDRRRIQQGRQDAKEQVGAVGGKGKGGRISRPRERVRERETQRVGEKKGKRERTGRRGGEIEGERAGFKWDVTERMGGETRERVGERVRGGIK